MLKEDYTARVPQDIPVIHNLQDGSHVQSIGFQSEKPRKRDKDKVPPQVLLAYTSSRARGGDPRQCPHGADLCKRVRRCDALTHEDVEGVMDDEAIAGRGFVLNGVFVPGGHDLRWPVFSCRCRKPDRSVVGPGMCWMRLG